MTQKQYKPLYKVLDEQRTQGEWINDNDMVANGVEPTDETIFGSFLGEDYHYPCVHERSKNEAKVNAAYTALAVNNLANLAEALQNFITDCELSGWGYNPDHIEQAKEALNKIS